MTVDDALMKAITGTVNASFAILIVALARRRAMPIALGAFLALIALNQFADALRAVTEDPVANERLARLAGVFAAADPFALYYFGSLFPTRNSLNAPRRALWIAVPGAALALTAAFATPDVVGSPPERALAFALVAYTAIVYAIVFAHALALRAPRPPAAFVAAMGVVAFPVFARLGESANSLVNEAGNVYWTDLAIRAAFLAIAVTGAIAFATRLGIARKSLALPLAWGVGVSAFFLVPVLVVAIDASLIARPWELALGRAANSVRWLFFGGLISVAVLRDGLIDISAAGRRLAARVVMGLAFLSFTALVLDVTIGLGSGGFRLGSVEAILLVAAIVLSQGFRELVDRAARALYAIPRANAPDDSLRAGATIADRYRIERMLAVGTGSRIFLAHDTRERQDVIIKEITLDPRISSRLGATEARLAGLLAHRHVMRVIQVIEPPGTCLIVCEHLAGGTLAERVRETGRLSVREGRIVMEQILSGLAHVHGAGIVHRDVKPSNIMFDALGNAKVTDFGVARLVHEDATRVPGVVGTPAYMAPEQMAGETATPATDVYAVGLLVRRCVALPLPEGLEAIVAKALQEDPRERWQDAGAMLAAWRAQPLGSQ